MEAGRTGVAEEEEVVVGVADLLESSVHDLGSWLACNVRGSLDAR